MQEVQPEDTYRAALEQVPSALEQSYRDLVALGPMPLDGNEVTTAILLRLRAYYASQNQITDFLRKRYVAAAADFFVEAVLFYLKALIETHHLDLTADSERPIIRKRGALRPDISMWRGNDLVAAIECKTQLGWSRHNWEADFLRREQGLREHHPGAAAFLVVMTSRNWAGLANNPKSGNQYFVLCEKWPTAISTTDASQLIVTPIEDLFRQIISLSR